MTDPAVVRAALTPVIQAAVLDAFKLGVGHAIRSIEGRRSEGWFTGAHAELGFVADELRAYVATMTHEDLP